MTALAACGLYGLLCTPVALTPSTLARLGPCAVDVFRLLFMWRALPIINCYG